jgi:hypothetical protein
MFRGSGSERAQLKYGNSRLLTNSETPLLAQVAWHVRLVSRREELCRDRLRDDSVDHAESARLRRRDLVVRHFLTSVPPLQSTRAADVSARLKFGSVLTTAKSRYGARVARKLKGPIR